MFPPMYAFCGNFDWGVLVFTSCRELEKMMTGNAKSVADKSEFIQRMMHGYGARSFVYMQDSKRQNNIKKLFKTWYTGENRDKVL